LRHDRCVIPSRVVTIASLPFRSLTTPNPASGVNGIT
jgi:hypothetical protein